MADSYARQKAVRILGAPDLHHLHRVDGQHQLTVVKPLPTTSAGCKFELRNNFVDVHDKGKHGTVIETEQSIVNRESGELYTNVVSSGFIA